MLNKKRILVLSQAKSRQNTEEILKTFDFLIYESIQYIILMPWIPCIFVQLHLDPTKCTTAGQNTRRTPTVNHDSGVGANEKEPRNNSSTTYLTEGQLKKKFGLKIHLKMARDWRRNMSGKILKN
jgi:hypothetical protein